MRSDRMEKGELTGVGAAQPLALRPGRVQRGAKPVSSSVGSRRGFGLRPHRPFSDISPPSRATELSAF
eukprot:3271610-Prymnesium_polylepis.1